MALNQKQEEFCRQYLLTGNASEAYRRAYPGSEEWKPDSVWNKASKMLAKDEVKTRIEELRESIEELTGISKAKIVEGLNEIFEQMRQSETASAVAAAKQISKMMGYDAPEKKDITSNGESIKSVIIE